MSSVFLQLVRAAFTATTTNDQRRAATLQLMLVEAELTSDEVVLAGLGLLAAVEEEEEVAVRVHGAALLREALQARRIVPAALHLENLVRWHCSSSLPLPVCAGVHALLVECALCSTPEELDSLLGTLCAVAVAQPRGLLLLGGVVEALLDPTPEQAPRQHSAQLQEAAMRRGSGVLGTATQALYTAFTASGGAQATALAPGTEVCVEAAFALLAVLAPKVSSAVWDECGLAVTLKALLEWAPGRRQAISCATALLRSATPSSPSRVAAVKLVLAVVLPWMAAPATWPDTATLDAVLCLVVGLLGASPAMQELSTFAQVVRATSAADMDDRQGLQGSLTVLAAVFRRSSPAPDLLERCERQLFPQVRRLVLHLHSSLPAASTPAFGGPGATNEAATHAILGHMRGAVWAIVRVLSPPLLEGILQDLAGSATLPVQVARRLSEECLIPIGEARPELLAGVVGVWCRLFSRREGWGDAAAWQVWAKEVLSFLQFAVVTPQLWRGRERLLLQLLELGTAVLDSGADRIAAVWFLLKVIRPEPADVAPTEVQVAFAAARIAAYARVVRFATQANAAELPHGVRAALLCELRGRFLRSPPLFAQALAMAGIAQQEVQRLQNDLEAASSLQEGARLVGDYLFGLAAASRAAP